MCKSQTLAIPRTLAPHFWFVLTIPQTNEMKQQNTTSKSSVRIRAAQRIAGQPQHAQRRRTRDARPRAQSVGVRRGRDAVARYVECVQRGQKGNRRLETRAGPMKREEITHKQMKSPLSPSQLVAR